MRHVWFVRNTFCALCQHNQASVIFFYTWAVYGRPINAEAWLPFGLKVSRDCRLSIVCLSLLAFSMLYRKSDLWSLSVERLCKINLSRLYLRPGWCFFSLFFLILSFSNWWLHFFSCSFAKGPKRLRTVHQSETIGCPAQSFAMEIFIANQIMEYTTMSSFSILGIRFLPRVSV